MKSILVCLRAMQLFAHSAHNLVSRTPFHQDHEFFGEVYSAMEGDYDDVIERIIGLYGEDSLELKSLLVEVHNKLQDAPSVGVKENSVFYVYLLDKEKYLCSEISNYLKSPVSPGVEQLLGDICNKSEMRQYKIKQRLKK